MGFETASLGGRAGAISAVPEASRRMTQWLQAQMAWRGGCNLHLQSRQQRHLGVSCFVGSWNLIMRYQWIWPCLLTIGLITRASPIRVDGRLRDDPGSERVLLQ